MKKSRKVISYIEDLVEEALGECTEEDLELVNLFFSYITHEIKDVSDTIGFRIPKIGTLYQDRHLLSGKIIGTNKETDFNRWVKYSNTISDIDMFCDSEGGTIRNIMTPLMRIFETTLKNKFEFGNKRVLDEGKVQPLFYVAAEKIQNDNYNKHIEKQ